MNQRFRTFLITAALSLTATCAAARTMTAAELPYEHVSDQVSQPGETKQAFLLRMAPVLREWANQTGMEACAEIGASDDGRYGLVVGTNHSHLGCVIDPNRVLPGMHATNETIHTHGRGNAFSPNAADMVMMDAQTAQRVDAVRAMRRPLLGGQTLNRFSAADYASGPGYLATPTGLIYQHGEGTDQVITP